MSEGFQDRESYVLRAFRQTWRLTEPRRSRGSEYRVGSYDAFMEKVSPEPNSGCWLWAGSRSTKGGVSGHGAFYFAGRGAIGAHRASWEFHCGPIPEGMVVCHKCDTPLCVNPNHLFLGTQKENVLDCARKGRKPRGEGVATAVLTESQVVLIKRMLRGSGVSASAIAERFGVSRTTIRRIAAGETWKHVEFVKGRTAAPTASPDEVEEIHIAGPAPTGRMDGKSWESSRGAVHGSQDDHGENECPPSRTTEKITGPGNQ